jgi:hypothetical protein
MRGHAYVGLVPFAVSLALSSHARAQDDAEKAACISASDQGQQLRDDGKYTRAREAFARCARETCPVLLRSDCTHWLLDIDQSSATVVVNAKDDKGNDLVDVIVTVDGRPLVSKLDGKPLTVDPGEHVFRYEFAGFPPVEEHAVIHAAEKNRALNVRFGAAVPSLQTPETAERAPDGVGHARSSEPRVAAWVFAGVAVAAFASEAYFGISGLSQRSTDLKTPPAGCAPTCPSSEKSQIQTKFAVADVSLGLGILSAGLARYFFLRPSETPRAVSIDLVPRPGGGEALLVGQF